MKMRSNATLTFKDIIYLFFFGVVGPPTKIFFPNSGTKKMLLLILSNKPLFFDSPLSLSWFSICICLLLCSVGAHSLHDIFLIKPKAIIDRLSWTFCCYKPSRRFLSKKLVFPRNFNARTKL